nr:YfbU family protein [uncultured Desulfobacter sp.]
MKLSDGEKLILLMLSELYEKFDVKGEIEPEFIRSAIFNEHTWSIPWKYPGIPFEQEETPQVVSEVLDILEMWSVIENSYRQFSKEDKKLIEEETEPFGKDPKFKGFDGNNETEHMSAATFLINDLDRFTEFKERYLNSHCPTLETYRRMLAAFEEVKNGNIYYPMTAQQVIKILKEKTHPDYR